MQAVGGVFQTTGWPGVVTVMGNWFGREKRGFIFGVWNSHTSLGNILGSLVAAKYVEYDWGLSFMVPGAIMGLVGFFVFLFLVPNPADIGCSPPNSHVYRKIEASNSSDDDAYVDVGDGLHSTGEDVSLYIGTDHSVILSNISTRCVSMSCLVIIQLYNHFRLDF